MSKRTILGLLCMLQEAQHFGVDTRSILANHGMDLSTIDPSAEIDRTMELAILAQIAEQIDDPAVGLRIAEAISVAIYGPLLMILISCENGHQALATGIRFQELTYLHGHLRSEPMFECTALIIDPYPLPAALERLLIDSDLAGTYRLIRDVQRQLAIEYPVEEIWIPYRRPTEFAEYENYFQCHVKFSMPDSRLLIRNEFLDRPFKSANAKAFELYQKQCESLLAEKHRDESLSTRIADHLSIFVEKLPHIDDVARAFDMNTRALRRRLSEEGRNFRDILAQTRIDKAKHYLQNSQLNIETIARYLGYAEPASFIHAFHRLTGVSPSTFRQKNKASD